ncbi:hypothetical protein BGZ98_001138, partial [Dissophora globulifera]
MFARKKQDRSTATTDQHQYTSTTAETMCRCNPRIDHRRRRRADGAPVPESDIEREQTIDFDEDDEELGMFDQEHDWKAIYQRTSNWYQGRPKGYCPLMLPSLTTLASATQALSETASSTLVPSASLFATSSISPSTRADSRQRTTSGQSLSTPAQRAIKKMLKKRKPMTVVGLQHEGSALTAFSLASYPTNNFDFGRDGKVKTLGEASHSRLHQVALIRSNPHYREKRPGATNGTQKPNIMAQDPWNHEHVAFAVRSSPIGDDNSADSSGSTLNGQDALPSGISGASASLSTDTQHQDPATLDALQGSVDTSTDPHAEAQQSDDPANDILCHYSSPLHSFLVTGHMDGSVRLWDMSIRDSRQQCIRHWQTGARRRVLCVGMNPRVVVCGNADSTLCVWDIHPDPNSSLSSHGTIHTASYLASAVPSDLEDWLSGIEIICVGDSLVACSTEFSGSVLVFSLATGSLVYEIPGLYRPSKMCMTDFFLLTGGRGTRSQDRRMRSQHIFHQQQGQTQWNMEGDTTGHQFRRTTAPASEVDEFMGCCVNVWDLRTGTRLYSLIPRLPMQQPQLSRSTHTSVDNPQLSQKKNTGQRYLQPLIRSETHSLDSIHPQFGGEAHESAWGTRLGSSSRPADTVTIISTQTPQGDRRNTTVPSISPRRPISAPLTLLDIAVTPDHSTLVVTLCEQSGEGREGVYCWDFDGSRLQGYHEQGHQMVTMIVDKQDIKYQEESDTDSAEDEVSRSAENSAGESPDEEDEESSHNLYSNDRFNNNMIMQQVDSTIFRDLHQARITGKVWVGWKLDEREFQRRKAIHQRRTRD